MNKKNVLKLSITLFGIFCLIAGAIGFSILGIPGVLAHMITILVASIIYEFRKILNENKN